MVRKYTDKELLDRVKSLPGFKSIPESLWLIGVRSKADLPDEFDDKFYLYKGEQFIMMATGTTHPGASILRGGYKSYNPLGAAIVKADKWYYNLWMYGKHKKRMNALVQIGAPITVFRDGDGDLKSEELGKEVDGYFGINFHANTYDMEKTTIREKIEGWSAGCQVVNDTQKYVLMMQFFAQQSGKKVSYCLLKEF
jgi:hypothetical protein